MVVSGAKCAIASITDENIYVDKKTFIDDDYNEDEVKVVVKVIEGLLDMIVFNRGDEDIIRLLKEIRECSNYLIGDRINEARLRIKGTECLDH